MLIKKPICDLGSLCNFLTACEELLITGGQLGKLLNAQTGEHYYQHKSPLNCGVTFKKEGKTFFAAGSYTGEALVFEKQAGKLVFVKAIKLHENAIKGLSANHEKLFSVCADRSIHFTTVLD